MVASMSRGKKAYLQYESQLSEAIARLALLREELKSAIVADAESYNVVMKAYKSAKESSDGEATISAALKQATSVPLGVAEKAVEVAEIATTLTPITNPNMKSDLTTAIALAKAALEGALANVEINLESLKDAPFINQTRKRAAALKSENRSHFMIWFQVTVWRDGQSDDLSALDTSPSSSRAVPADVRTIWAGRYAWQPTRRWLLSERANQKCQALRSITGGPFLWMSLSLAWVVVP